MSQSRSNPAGAGAALPLDPRTYTRGLACVHCGLCLPACPTYIQTGHEADSPRGRIQLMLGLADGVIEPTESVVRHLDLCLDCRACETACPSGVVYHELIEETRVRLDETSHRSAQTRFMRWVFFNVFVHPNRLKLALLPARLMQKLGLYGLLRRSGLFRLLPMQLRRMEQMLPESGELWPRALAERYVSGKATERQADRENGGSPVSPGATGRRTRRPVPAVVTAHGSRSTATSAGGRHGTQVSEYRDLCHPPPEGEGARVVFFPGCIGSVMYQRVNRQAVELLAAGGAEVIVPRRLGCCGAIHHHNAAITAARDLARRNIDAVFAAGQPEPDFIATCIAGCGAMLREYDHLLRDDPHYAERARRFSAKVRDITEVLSELPLPLEEARGEAGPTPLVSTYHDACHLAHAQQVVDPPRRLLKRIPGLKLVPLPESDICCGAAGTYNLTQPEMSADLAERKLRNIAATGATVCITGNVGCAMQIQSAAAAHGQKLLVRHPVELLHEAVFHQNEPERPRP